MQSPSQNQTQRVIGGVFPLEEPASTTQTNQDWSFLQQGVLHLASARGAFTLLVRTLRPRRVWLPSYLCSSIVEAFREADTEVVFFPVGRDLRCESAVWLDRVAPGDFVLRIHYFGFPNSDPVFEEGALRGAWLVDDAAQALLSEGVGAGADFVVFSPRKFVGVPDGGCMIMRHPLPDLPPQFPPASTAWWRKSLSAVTLRREFDAGSHDRAWFPTFQHAEGQVPIEPQSMSELSYRLLSRGINYTSIASRRRDNYKLLLEHIGEVAIFPELLQGVVPLGFPVQIRRRDAIRDALFKEQIFPPVHWPLDGCVPASFANSHALTHEIMTLPCDQRYDAEDMRRILEVWHEANARAMTLAATAQ
jgi:hypothetical protein